ncbi:hypothetical protein NDU88_000514 [Pleurodeles waltl]|uniref:Uncharacterized protein n=1 Tax=Pleurodeles waltl TaxID=8319 RepID=A0AAV7UTL1_PLEWA|nr:hypothetical protein NDU88_000514 [Pleurodeles waltl]
MGPTIETHPSQKHTEKEAAIEAVADIARQKRMGSHSGTDTGGSVKDSEADKPDLENERLPVVTPQSLAKLITHCIVTLPINMIVPICSSLTGSKLMGVSSLKWIDNAR